MWLWGFVYLGVLIISLYLGFEFITRVAKFILEYWDLALTWLWSSLLIVSPFALFKKTRDFSATSILYISYGFGILVWALGTAIAASDKSMWLFLALFFLRSWGGATIGILSSLIEGNWPLVWLLVKGLLLVLSIRVFSIWLIAKKDD